MSCFHQAEGMLLSVTKLLQEWLNKISNKVPQFPAAHMQLPGGQGKAMAVAPGGDTGTLTSRLGAFRPEEESLL